MIKHQLKFEETLEDNDYGLIISEDGLLKGIWVAEHLQDKPYPLPLEIMCRTHFGIEINEPDAGPALH